MDDYYYNDMMSPYTRNESNAALIAVVIFVIVLVIVGIILALYFTCTTPFGGSDKCQCTNSGGTWDGTTCTCPTTSEIVGAGKTCVVKCAAGKTRDSKGVCGGSAPPACTSTQELVNGKCAEKCASGQVRDSSGICQLSCSTGKVSNGLACVDDLSGNWLGYVTSTNLPNSSYNWNIKHTTGGVAIYSGTTLKTTIPFDGTALTWGTIKGTWVPLSRRITWSNDSHWIKQ
jgi:hypothetical protein